MTDEHKKRISETLKRKGIKPPSRRGATMSLEAREKIRKHHIKFGIKPPPLFSWRGKKFSKEHIRNLSLSHKNSPNTKHGDQCWNWRGGITPVYLRIRNSQEYKRWRKFVLERDRYSCVSCGVSRNEKKLHADHIKPFALFESLRFVVENGRTLCVDCHKKIGWRGNQYGQCELLV